MDYTWGCTRRYKLQPWKHWDDEVPTMIGLAHGYMSFGDLYVHVALPCRPGERICQRCCLPTRHVPYRGTGTSMTHMTRVSTPCPYYDRRGNRIAEHVKRELS